MTSDVQWEVFKRPLGVIPPGAYEVRATRIMGDTRVIVRIAADADSFFATARGILLAQRMADAISPVTAFLETVANEGPCECGAHSCTHEPRRLWCLDPCKKHRSLHASLVRYDHERST